jgi:stage V sporulation protein AB
MMRFIVPAVIGVCSGTAIGVAVMAIYSVFDFVSVLNVESSDIGFEDRFEWMVIAGSLFSTVFHLFGLSIAFPGWVLAIAGVFFGIFVGLLAASLTDVLGFIPVLISKRNGAISLAAVIIAMGLGRMVGSIYFFLYR